ncbi:hypothetical protein QT384_06735 [Arcobacter cryaerophilus gv. pseudocryaerophilus]|uniref:Nucleotide modification associated domain-containing protein n=3 Tax=Arcobacteraceae TaxID=2808963 RepID=A0AA96DSS4_9BACT|nr:hypothetical protein RMP68_05900 [Arcobacter sp. AZ-2023]WNL35385.1 hypothetical protein RMQ66_06735 [Arcobacter sp. AZ-2023]WPD11101.1 hypothetical protein QT384_06735 [Arcobacter sp. DSM 115960]
MQTKIYFYKMIVDNGGAPCVQDGLLSLAICKPQIRSTIDTNDFIIGFGSNVLDNKLIYIAKITDKLLDGEYYKQEKYFYRDDCLYSFDGQQYSRRENKKYHIGNNTPTDEGNDIVLLSNNYRYFGNKSSNDYKKKYPILTKIINSLKQGHRLNHNTELFKELSQLIDETFSQKQLNILQPLNYNKSLNCSSIEETLECIERKDKE